MTEQVAEAPVETEAAVETEVQIEETPNFPDEMAEAAFKQLSNLISQRNSKVGQINAVKGDRQTLTEQVAAESDNPSIVSARQAEQAAKEAWDEAVMALHSVVTPEVDRLLSDSESSVKEIEEQVKELDSTIKPGSNYFKKMYGENLAKFLPSLARLKGFSTKGAGASGRRVRGFDVAVTIDGETQGFENFASAAKYLDLETAALQEAFFKAAGKDNLKDIADRVDFTVTYTDTDENGNTDEYEATVIATREVKEDEEVDTSDDE